MIDYFWHRPKKDNIKLSMVILVKNEEDIIKENILFHSKMGVDSFVVMDNNSTDSTRDILKELQKEVELTIIDEKGDYQQSKFMTKLAKIAKRKYKPDWIINSDADEFWVPKNNQNLKEVLSKQKASILLVPRNNMVLYQGLTNWKHNIYRVANPVCRMDNFKNPYFLGKIGNKTIIKPKGYFKTNSGNHSVEHLFFWRKKEIKEIVIFHFPVREFKHFENNIKNRHQLLKRGMKMGKQYKKWTKLYEQGKLKKSYNDMFLTQTELEILEKCFIIKKDQTLLNLFEKFNLI